MPSSKICFGFSTFFLLALLFAAAASAQEDAVKIAVFPFEVNADEDLNYLNDSLPELLRDRLSEAGFQLVGADAVAKALADSGATSLNLDQARQLALATGANYALYGTFSQLGEALSLEAQFVDAFGLDSAVPVFSNKDGLINLLPLVDEVVAQVKSTAMKQETIASIDVEGSKILDKDVVLIRLSMKKGDEYSPKGVNDDIKAIYGLGYFDDVQVRVTDVTGGKRVVFQVKEKPRIQSVGVRGNESLDDDEIIEIISSKIGAVLNPNVLKQDLATVRAFYRHKGFYQTKVDYEVEGGETGQAKLNIVIEEGKELYINEIVFDGAKQLAPDELKDQLSLSEKGFFYWITDSGVLNEELLDRDGAAIQAYYANRGFLDVKVARPEVDIRDDGIYVTFRIEEGNRFKISDITFAGDLIATEEEFFEKMESDELMADDEYMNSEIVRNDIEKLTEFYNNKGFAYADVGTRFRPNAEDMTVEIVFDVSKHQRVHIRRVFLTGNTVTRDNVILRSIYLADGDQYNGSSIESSIQSLKGLDYFSGVDIEPIPTGDPSEMDLKVSVQEKPTGAIGGGFGYSSSGGFYVAGDISERNLFGKGYNLALATKFGGTTTSWTLDFYNPRVNDEYWGLGFGTSLTQAEYDEFDKDSLGFGVRGVHAIGPRTLLNLTYNVDIYDIKNVDADASSSIKEAEGAHFGSAVGAELNRSTLRKNSFYYSEGMANSIGVTVGGGFLGGTDDYVKWGHTTDFYQTLVGDLVFHGKAGLGFLHENFGGKDVPISQRYSLGGINSVRGYTSGKISPRDDNGDRIGGNKYLSTNLEMLYPLSKEYGILGVAFFDAGNAWKEGEFFFDEVNPPEETYSSAPSFGMFKSVGGGIRWMSPMGPLRIEYGFGLDELDDSGSSKFEFSMGQSF